MLKFVVIPNRLSCSAVKYHRLNRRIQGCCSQTNINKIETVAVVEAIVWRHCTGPGFASQCKTSGMTSEAYDV